MARATTAMLLTASLILFSSCVKDDYGDCPVDGLYVRFEPNNPAHEFRDLVRTVDLFFYHSDDELAAAYNFTKEDLRPGDLAAHITDIASGEYRVVAVINSIEHYETSGSGNYGSLRSRIVKETSNTRLTDFFSSEKNITVGSSPSGVHTETMPLGKHNNEIELAVRYEDYTLPAGTWIAAYITGGNGDINYQGYKSGETAFRTYLPHTERLHDDGKLEQSSISTFRLWTGADVNLLITEVSDNSGFQPRYVRLNICDELAKVRDNEGNYMYDTDDKLEYYDLYRISVTLSADMQVISLSVNDWYTIGGDTEV